MNDINNLFFELIRVAIGNAVCLSHTPTNAEWMQLYELAKKQSLVGICFAGVQRLQGQQQTPSEQLYLQWMGMAAKIQQRNEVLDRKTVEALTYFREKGFACTCLKGQGIASLYNEKLSKLRQSGDIDIWLDCSREQLYEFSKRELGKVEGITYHHIHYPLWSDPEIEAHIYPSFLSSPMCNKALKEFCEVHKPKLDSHKPSAINHKPSIDTPSLAFNRVYILLHCYRHFCGHGIGLRQLLDYYFVLRTSYDNVNDDDNLTYKTEAMMWIDRMGMTRFAQATMWLMQEVLRLDTEYLLCEPNEKYGRFLLEEVMRCGNFGKYDEGGMKAMGSAIGRYVYNLKRDIRLIKICPHEALWDPFFNVYQYVMTRFVWSKM